MEVGWAVWIPDCPELGFPIKLDPIFGLGLQTSERVPRSEGIAPVPVLGVYSAPTVGEVKKGFNWGIRQN